MVLQTHIHPDHYDATVKEHLPKDIPYYTQPQDKETVEQDGFTQVKPIEDMTVSGNMTIHRVSGHHGFGKSVNDGCRVWICIDGGRLPYHIYYGRLQVGKVHRRNRGKIQT